MEATFWRLIYKELLSIEYGIWSKDKILNTGV